MRRAHERRLAVPLLAGLLVAGSLVGCNDLTGSQKLPAGTSDPASYHTPEGGRTLRNGALYDLAQLLPLYITDAGLITDELTSDQAGASAGAIVNFTVPEWGSLDERILPELTSGSTAAAGQDYTSLQRVRGDISQALGVLAAYDTSANAPVLRGELYALNGYTEILLADQFCSGIPLSTLDFNQDFTYRPGSTTEEVYQHALAQEDSALTLAAGNDTITYLAAVLKGRALLNLGQYAQAAQAVAAVPDDFGYHLAIQWVSQGVSSNTLNNLATVADQEGVNGLPYLSSNDPRTAVVVTGTNSQTGTILYFPKRYKYAPGEYTQFPIATGIEARLIEAEAALQAGDPITWLGKLNHLRETASVPEQTGTLADTTDPGTDSARVSLLFHERAYWLFVSAHRQGDLRRLIRQYGRNAEQVYPTGAYAAPGAGTYGTDVTVPLSPSEYINPLFHGCKNREP
jgi:hypothetical protein